MDMVVNEARDEGKDGSGGTSTGWSFDFIVARSARWKERSWQATR